MNDNIFDLYTFSFKNIFKILFDRKLTVIIVTSIFALTSIVISLAIPNQYISSATIRIEEDKQSSLSTAMSQLGGLAALGGISINQTQSKTNLVYEKLKSKEFLKHLLKIEGFLENIVAANGYNPLTKEIIYNKSNFDPVSRKWVRDIPKSRQLVPSYIEVFEHKNFSKKYKVSLDKKNGFINISFKHYSPYFAFEFLNHAIKEMDLINREKDLQNSKDSISYFQGVLDETSDKAIRELIYNLLELNFKTEMLANVNEFYLLDVIDAPYIPEVKSEPRRSIIVVLSTLLGFLIISIFILFNSRNLIK